MIPTTAAVDARHAPAGPATDTLRRSLEAATRALDFALPPALEAHEPPEARGLRRDDVRLLVSDRADDRTEDAHFRDLGRFLDPGDVLVINTSGTLNAALAGTRADGTPIELHLSTHLPADLWIVEVRRPGHGGTQPFPEATAGEVLRLPGGATATLHVPYLADRSAPAPRETRLWIATLALPTPLHPYLSAHGFPIRYSYVPEPWPLEYYQSAYATEPGSAEMPSAGRGFTPELITALTAQGVVFAPLVLHTGVASLESHEPPYEEYYRVPEFDGGARHGRAGGGEARDRGGHHGRARAGDGDDGERHGPRGRGLDLPGGHAGARGARRDRPAHRLP